jgi:hypothetical protein
MLDSLFKDYCNRLVSNYIQFSHANQHSTIIIIIRGVGLSPLGTAVTSGLLYKPQMIDEGDCGAIGGMKIGRGNLPQRHFVHHKPHMTRPRLKPGPPR